MKRLSILSLGWEFPPVYTGGLGKACFELNRHLSKQNRIFLVLPAAVPEIFTQGMIPLKSRGKIKRKTEWTAIARKVIHTKTHLNPYEAVERFEEAFIEYTALPKGKAREYRQLPEKLKQFTQEAVEAALGNAGFDLIYAHDWMTFPAALQLKDMTGKPLVVHVHSLETDRSGQTGNLAWEIECEAFQTADLIIAVSEFSATQLRERYGVAAEKIRVVYHGKDSISPERKESGFTEKTVVFVGRVTDQKNPWLFLAIAEKILEERQDVRFVMAGTGDMLDALIEAVASKGLSARFHFTGFLEPEQVKELLAQADVFCLTSKSEPFGLSAIEAAQAGVPCVLSANSGAAEVLPSALIVHPEDVNGFSQSVNRLLQSEAWRKYQADAQIEDLSRLSWQSAAAALDTYFREIV